MKLRIKTEEIELEVEQNFKEDNISYKEAPTNLLKLVEDIIQKCAEESLKITKLKYENKDFI